MRPDGEFEEWRVPYTVKDVQKLARKLTRKAPGQSSMLMDRDASEVVGRASGDHDELVIIDEPESGVVRVDPEFVEDARVRNGSAPSAHVVSSASRRAAWSRWSSSVYANSSRESTANSGLHHVDALGGHSGGPSCGASRPARPPRCWPGAARVASVFAIINALSGTSTPALR